MAFGQNRALFPDSWGVAPGYGDEGLRPMLPSVEKPPTSARCVGRWLLLVLRKAEV